MNKLSPDLPMVSGAPVSAENSPPERKAPVREGATRPGADNASAMLGPFGFVGLPVSLVLDWAIWGVWPAAMTLLGGAVVVFACVMSERATRRLAG